MKKFLALLGIIASVTLISLVIHILMTVRITPARIAAQICGHNKFVARGQQLRASIDNAYKKIPDDPTGTGTSLDSFLTPIVTQYIPLGTSFNDAEVILC